MMELESVEDSGLLILQAVALQVLTAPFLLLPSCPAVPHLRTTLGLDSRASLSYDFRIVELCDLVPPFTQVQPALGPGRQLQHQELRQSPQVPRHLATWPHNLLK